MNSNQNSRPGQNRGPSRSHARTHARTYAMRILYQREMSGQSVRRMVERGTCMIENDMARDCECPHIESCVPRNVFEASGAWPVDYRCPYELLPTADRNRRCARSKVCRCRRYYLERKECPPAGYPYADGDTSVDRCRCEYYKKCEYRKYFDSFAVAPDGYAIEIAEGVERHLDEIDRVITEVSEHWAVFRMPVIDRNILRVAVWEMRYTEDVPDSVAINEAVSLAKEYGGADSSKFVNGVLGKIARLATSGGQDGDGEPSETTEGDQPE